MFFALSVQFLFVFYYTNTYNKFGNITGMDLKKEYHTLSKNDFTNLINSLKDNDGVIKFFSFNKEYFYYPEVTTLTLLFELENSLKVFHDTFDTFDEFLKKQLEQSFFINEIISTNEIENIYSTRHDVFYLMNTPSSLKIKKGNKVASLINGYLYHFSMHSIDSLESIREAYDSIILPTLDSKEDYPDGLLFRKNSVDITDGISIVHTGFQNEEEINKGLNEFIGIYLNKDINLYLRGLITHFMFETIHPFYDGNGRLGRYFLSALFMKENGFCEGMLVSTSILKNKNKYYHALELGRRYDQGGCINEYLNAMLGILIDGINKSIEDLNYKKEEINKYHCEKLTKKENAIYNILLGGSLFTFYGVSMDEIIKYADVSRRTSVSTLTKFKKMYKVKEVTFGKKVFYSFDLSSL